MGYFDQNGQWTDDPGPPPADQGFGWGPLEGLFGGGQKSPPPPGPGAFSTARQGPPPPQMTPADQGDRRAASGIAPPPPAGANDEIPLNPVDAAHARLLNAQAAQAEADLNDPSKRAAAELQLKRIQLEIDKMASDLSPQDAAKLQDQLAREREQIRQQFEADQADKNRQFNAAQTAAKNQFDSSENAAQRAFTGEQNDLSRGVSLRGQEIERLKAQDDWVLGMLRQQVAEGTLSLQRATSMFNAYVDRARLPSQIMESVSRAIQPFSFQVPGKNYVAPGHEKGGATDVLARAAGIDPNTLERNPFKGMKDVDLFKLAKKAGADFKNSSIPDPGQVFGSVPIPQTDFSQYQSALAGMPPAFPGGAGGAPPPPSAPPPSDAGAGPAGSVTPAPSWQMSDDQIARLNSLLDGAAAQP